MSTRTPPVGDPEILTTLADLWPGAQVRAGHDRHAVAEFVALPPHDPRVLVPATDRRAAASAMLQFSDDSSLGTIGRRMAGAAWLRATRARGLQRLAVVGGGDGSLRDHLAELLGTEVTYSVTIGTARVNRKPVLQVCDPDGRTLAFAKLGVSAQSRRDVTAESVALRTLARSTWHTFRAPEVLHIGRWHTYLVLLLSPLASGPRLLPRGAPRPPLAAMRELTAAYAQPPMLLPQLPWAQRVRASFDGLADRELAGRANAALDLLLDRSEGQPVTAGAWHGDWTPWNMSTSGGRIQLWDWERFEIDAPAGLDALHFRVNVATRARGTTPDVVADALIGADRLQVGEYLAAITARYLPLAEQPRGAAIAPRGLCMLDAFTRWAGAGQRDR